MNTYSIDSKIAARTYALTMAVQLMSSAYKEDKTCIDYAKEFEEYLIGNTNLPEVAEDLNLKVLDMWNKTNKFLEG